MYKPAFGNVKVCIRKRGGSEKRLWLQNDGEQDVRVFVQQLPGNRVPNSIMLKSGCEESCFLHPATTSIELRTQTNSEVVATCTLTGDTGLSVRQAESAAA